MLYYNVSSQGSGETASGESGFSAGAETVSAAKINARRKSWDLAAFVQWVVQVCEPDTILHTPFLALTLEYGRWLLTPAPKDPEERPDPVFSAEHTIGILRSVSTHANLVGGASVTKNWGRWELADDARYAVGRGLAAEAASMIAWVMADALEQLPVDYPREIERLAEKLGNAKGFEELIGKTASPAVCGVKQTTAANKWQGEFMKAANEVLR